MKFTHQVSISRTDEDENTTLLYDAVPAHIQPIKRNAKLGDDYVEHAHMMDYVVNIPHSYDVRIGDELTFVDDLGHARTVTITHYDLIAFRYRPPYIELTTSLGK